MKPDQDAELAKVVAEKLNGKFWQVTRGDWWVVVEGVTSQRLVIWTNDPFGVSFTPKALNMALQELRGKVMEQLLLDGIVSEDGAWAHGTAN